jgi:hypothetical protein
MKILLIIFLIILRIAIGFNIVYWLVQEFRFPDQHSFVEIEFYLVLLVFDIWVSMTNMVIERVSDDKNKD